MKVFTGGEKTGTLPFTGINECTPKKAAIETMTAIPAKIAMVYLYFENFDFLSLKFCCRLPFFGIQKKKPCSIYLLSD